MTVPTGVAGPPTFTWRVTRMRPEQLAAVPTLRFRLEVHCSGEQLVNCIALTVSVRLAVALRDYDAATRARLRGVFGVAEQWQDSLRDVVWAQPTVIVPRFVGDTAVDIPVPCGQDMDLASVSYLHALTDGDIPLRFLFSGTVFHQSDGRLATAQIPWDGEATYRMPAQEWHDLREWYFGNHRWVRLDSEVFDRLHEYRVAYAFPSLDAAVDALLTGQPDRLHSERRSVR